MNSDEIYRMKQLMGLSTPKSFVSENYKKEIKSRLIIEALTGGKDDLYKLIAKASGLSDETAEVFSKEASSFMKQSDEFAQALAKEGLDDVGKIQQKLSNAGYDVSNLDNAITMYFKQNPNVATEILVTIPKFTDNIIRNMSLEQVFSKRPDLIDPIKYLSGPNFNIRNQSVADEYKEMAGELSKLAASDGSESVKKILDLMDVKLESYNATKQVDSNSAANKIEPVKKNSETPKDVNKNVDTNIKWGNLGNGYQIANQITNYSGRYVVIVKEPSGRLRPFYQRTGGGGSDQGWASAGNWVPFYGIADVSIMTEKGLTRVDGWMIKPDNGRMGEVGDEKISQLLGDVVGTNGVKNADYEIGNFSKMMTNTPTPAALNDFLRAQGYEITPNNGALSKFQEPNVLHGIP